MGQFKNGHAIEQEILSQCRNDTITLNGKPDNFLKHDIEYEAYAMNSTLLFSWLNDWQAEESIFNNTINVTPSHSTFQLSCAITSLVSVGLAFVPGGAAVDFMAGALNFYGGGCAVAELVS